MASQRGTPTGVLTAQVDRTPDRYICRNQDPREGKGRGNPDLPPLLSRNNEKDPVTGKGTVSVI